jgi:predicted MFS family arabinose efflux permease
MANDQLDSTDLPRSRSPWASLGYRDYRLLFSIALFATTAQQMRVTQNLFQVYELSGSAFQLGLTGLAQGIPLFALGLFGGTLADFVDRKKLLLITTAGNLLVAVALGILTLTGAIRVWHILLGTALTSALNIVLNPTRMALISKLVPRSHLTNAVSLNSSVSQAAHFIGPMIAGVSLEWMDIGNSYLFNALFYLPAAASIILIHTSGAPDGKKEPFSVGSFLGGLRFLFSEPIVLAMVILDFIVAGVGYYRPLLPIFAKDILYVGPAGFGILSSAPAVGGIIGTVLLLLIGDFEHKGLLALWSFLCYAVGVGVFAISRAGYRSFCLEPRLVNSLQAVMRQPPDFQPGSRPLCCLYIFPGRARLATQVGFMAALINAPGSLLFGCAVGSILTLACWAALPGLRRFGSEKAI